jgi:DNA-binding transcriptional LysR family regulator
VYLTEEGQRYLEKVGAIMNDFAEVNREMVLLGSNRKAIRYGTPPMIGFFLLSRVFSAFETLRPDVRLEIVEGGSLSLLPEIEAERIDVAIVATRGDSPKKHPGLSFKKVGATELVYCVSPEHRLAGNAFVTFDMLQRERLVLFKEGNLQRQIILGAFEALGIEPNIILRTNQLFTVVSFIRKNIGSSFLFRDAVNLVEGLVPVSFANKLDIDLCLVWKTTREHHQDVRIAIEFFKAWPVQE